jgi:hypothetical protein
MCCEKRAAYRKCAMSTKRLRTTVLHIKIKSASLHCVIQTLLNALLHQNRCSYYFDNYKIIHLCLTSITEFIEDAILLGRVPASMGNPEDKDTMSPQHLTIQLPTDAASYPTKTEYSATILQTSENSHRKLRDSKIQCHLEQAMISSIIIHHNHHNCYESQLKE